MSLLGSVNGTGQGYEVSFLKNGKTLEDLKCGVCHLAVRQAMQVPCGCRFCSTCILNQHYDESGKATCPNCNDEFFKEDIAPDHNARRKILTAVIYCPQKDQGCTETFQVKELNDHVKSCLYSPVACMHHSRGCEVKLMRKDLMNHLKTDCEYRLIECHYCKTNIPKSDFNEHKSSCAKLPVPCPNNCGAKEIQKDMMEKHVDEDCPLQEKTCKFQHYGCHFKGMLENLEKHMNDDVQKHLDMVTMATAMLDLKFSESLRHISELKSERSIEDGKEKELLKDLNDIKQTLKIKDERFGNLQRLFGAHLDKFRKFEARVETAADKNDIAALQQMIKPLQDSTRILTNKVQEIEQNHHAGGTVAVRSNMPAHAQLANFERELNIQSVRQSDYDLRFQLLETASYDGVLLWKISEIQRRKREANSGKVVSLYSQPFYTSRYGYKMCARMYLNGDGMGKGTHVSLFFVVMKGDYDALLQWPFSQKVTMILLDQETGQRSLTDSFKPDTRSSSFKRPTGDMNIASGCPLFVSQQILRDTTYIKDDTMFIKFIVDTSDLYM